MKNSLTVLFELNWSSEEGALDKDGLGYKGIKQAATLYDPNYPLLNQRTRYVFVLDVPRQQAVLGHLLHGCETGGYSYKTRWFSNELTAL